jgi:hypothetical protein
MLEFATQCGKEAVGGGRFGRTKLKGPELGISGPCTQRVGGGRGLAARDAVCVVSILAISDLLVQ